MRRNDKVKPFFGIPMEKAKIKEHDDLSLPSLLFSDFLWIFYALVSKIMVQFFGIPMAKSKIKGT